MALLKFLPDNTKINFVGARYVAFAIDGLLLLATIVSISVYGFNLGIDFTGGVLLQVKSQQTIDIAHVRGEVDSLNFGDSQIQYIGSGACDTPVHSCVLIRVQPKAGQSGEQAAEVIKAKLGPAYTGRKAQVIGPKVSKELFHDGVLATILAVLAIAVYVAVRFEWQYGVGAVVATGHDVLVTAGLFSLLHWDFTLNSIAALLTLAGYSINDTVVVFDRIRENRRKFKRMKSGRPDQPVDQPDADAHDPDLGLDRDLDHSAADLRRAVAVRVHRRDPVRHRGRHLLLDLCGLGAAALSAGPGRHHQRRRHRGHDRLGRAPRRSAPR